MEEKEYIEWECPYCYVPYCFTKGEEAGKNII